MMYAISSESMRLSDENTIKNKGVSAIQLMDRAAHALFCLIEKNNPKNTAIVCGSGNNGGDGYALALKMLNNCNKVTVFGKTPKTASAKYYFDILQDNYSDNFVDIGKMNDLSQFDLVVDCLLGNGIKGELSEEYVQIINRINTAKYILSCDIPSGINSDNGKKSPVAVIANQTLAIQSYKTGHFLQDAKDCVGELKLCDIGIDIVGKKYFIVDEVYVKNNFSKKFNNSHKGDFGRCGIVACSQNFVGAGLLAQTSATAILGECVMRVGTGYSYLFVPEKMLSAMWGRVTHSCIFKHEDIAKHKLDSIAFGMGIGDNEKLFLDVLSHKSIKVIDADGLNILANNMDKISCLKGCVLTPHPMEFSRLTGVAVQDILQNPIEYAEQFAKQYEVVLLLKGATTIITNGEQTYLNIVGNCGQAKAGSGDVLSGIIAGLLAQKIEPLHAACIASFIAGKTAENIANKQSVYTMLPLDVANEVGYTLCKIINQ